MGLHPAQSSSSSALRSLPLKNFVEKKCAEGLMQQSPRRGTLRSL